MIFRHPGSKCQASRPSTIEAMPHLLARENSRNTNQVLSIVRRCRPEVGKSKRRPAVASIKGSDHSEKLVVGSDLNETAIGGEIVRRVIDGYVQNDGPDRARRSGDARWGVVERQGVGAEEAAGSRRTLRAGRALSPGRTCRAAGTGWADCTCGTSGAGCPGSARRTGRADGSGCTGGALRSLRTGSPFQVARTLRNHGDGSASL